MFLTACVEVNENKYDINLFNRFQLGNNAAFVKAIFELALSICKYASYHLVVLSGSVCFNEIKRKYK
jgi:hypothetical protein